jgi:hypothetical protein
MSNTHPSGVRQSTCSSARESTDGQISFFEQGFNPICRVNGLVDGDRNGRRAGFSGGKSFLARNA